MDPKERKKQVKQITRELKSKDSGDTAVLVDSLPFHFNIMLETSAGMMAQNEQIVKQNERLTNTIVDLQETIKDLR